MSQYRVTKKAGQCQLMRLPPCAALKRFRYWLRALGPMAALNKSPRLAPDALRRDLWHCGQDVMAAPMGALQCGQFTAVLWDEWA